jgi:endonuclease III
MKSKKDVKEIIKILKETYPEAECSLDFSNPFQMAVAVLLSAQCTDARVNIVTKELFKVAPTAKEMNTLTIKEIEKYIASCGLYKTKAKNIKGLAEMIMDKYNGEIPDTMEELIKLPGIGRKSANVVMLEAFHNPQGVAIDTHAKRICNRIGISKEESPEKIEQDLLKKIDKDEYFDANHLFVWHGRYTCKARKPECEKCTITKYCNYFKIKNK